MYTVIVARPARRDMQEQHDWWAEKRSAEQAARWYVALHKKLRSLEKNPQIHPHADEDGLWPYHVRQLSFGLGRKPTHRALFVIRDADVVVLRVRHLAQAPLTFDDL